MRYETSDLNLRALETRVAKRMSVPICFLDPRRRAILLIHGYNVNEAEAVRAMGTFREALAFYAPSLLADTFLCTWAGNWRIPGLRPAAYPFVLGNARESGTTLFEAMLEWYSRPTAPEELVIIAHSLGCRLLAEALKKMQAVGRPARMTKLTVILMAAAVPIAYFDIEGHLRAGLDAANGGVIVLYSWDDQVLSLVFGLGQTLAGDGLFPEAVGLRANPNGAPWTRTKAMPAFDHGDYWQEMETAELVCNVLGFATRPWQSGASLAARKMLNKRRLATMPLLPGL